MKVKKNPKADLNRWSSIFFLAGLVIMLFLSYEMLEWKSFETNDQVSEVLDVGDDLEMDIPITQELNTPPPPPPPPAQVQQVFEVIENELEVEETIIESTELDQDYTLVEIEEIEEVEAEEEEIVEIPFAVIEDVPIFPGCEDERGNDARKKCMSDNIMKFVQTRFNTELANELGLEGKQRISVMFKIDKHGDVVNVRARAPHNELEKEAVKVVNSLPKFVPGKQRGKPVGVLYALPILFKVEPQL